MDFRRKTRQRVEQKSEYESLEQLYPHNLMIYRLPPIGDISIQEFEDLALERLRVLRVLEQASNKSFRILTTEWKEYVNAELYKEGLKGYLKLCTSGSASTTTSATKWESLLQARRRDYISHFILRLCYCRTEALQRWFLQHEMELFKYKFSALSSTEIKQFLQLNKLNYTPIGEEEKELVKDGLFESTISQSVAKISMVEFYKVHFTEVLDLVRTRRCYLKKSYAYVSINDFISVLSAKQITEIEHGLQSAKGLIRQVESDDRLYHLLKSLHTSYTGKDFTVNKSGSIPIESLDILSKKSFPLCMRVCHEQIKATSHMKHNGRMQYGLFLKGIGVTLEDSLKFWRTEFTKKMDPERFAKSYEYNIYHNYGKKGSMINYTPYSCLKVIDANPGPGEVHGCPFKSYDQTMLKTKLAANGLSAAHIQEVVSYASKGHFQLACGKYFQITHNSTDDVSITHPNQYFEQSQMLMGNRSDKGNAKAKQRPLKRVGQSNDSSLMGGADDDELWNIAQTQESAYNSQRAEASAWDEDLDVSDIPM